MKKEVIVILVSLFGVNSLHSKSANHIFLYDDEGLSISQKAEALMQNS